MSKGPSNSQAYPSAASTSGEMVTLPPPQHQQNQDLYRHPTYDMYPGHPQDPHRGGPQSHMNYNQPAPRQRTAIACRYCRRRKVSANWNHWISRMLTISNRFAVPASKRLMMVVAQIANASSKSAFLLRFPLRRKLLCLLTPHIHI